MTPLFLLHRYGDAAAGAPWRDALEAGAWAGEWCAPDLPGHGDAPWESDLHEESDVVIPALRHLVAQAWATSPVVLAVGGSCTAAKLLGLGGRAAGLVLVAEFDGPWPASMDEALVVGHAWARALADDPVAVAPAPATGLDPRTAHGFPPRLDREYRAAQRAAVPVPVLDLPDGPPADVLAEAAQWWEARPGV